MFGSLAASVFGADLRGVRGRLAAALEAHHAGRGPADRIALGIGDGDHRVVEAGVDVRDAGRDVLALAPLNALGFACHVALSYLKLVLLEASRLGRTASGGEE